MEEIEFDNEKIDRFFKGKYSYEDSSYLDDVFCDKNNEYKLKILLSKQFDELLQQNQEDVKNLDHILYRIHYDINSRLSEKKTWLSDKILKWTLLVAGIAILPFIIFLSIQSYKGVHKNKETWIEINSPAWTRVQFSLPDGTKGWLNSNSSIKYNGNFTADRQVSLKGEAYFDVFNGHLEKPIVNIII